MLLLCLGAGSLLSMSFSGMLIKRVGCRAVMVLSAALWCAVLPLLATLDSLELLGWRTAVWQRCFSADQHLLCHCHHCGRIADGVSWTVARRQ
ncbi:hypothetical protein [Duffyella gerundensis]|uniref:hypothetical protein n=2 Tax=Duffyella TaxID=3026546 RepID=UPI003F6DDF8D